MYSQATCNVWRWWWSFFSCPTKCDKTRGELSLIHMHPNPSNCPTCRSLSEFTHVNRFVSMSQKVKLSCTDCSIWLRFNNYELAVSPPSWITYSTTIKIRDTMTFPSSCHEIWFHLFYFIYLWLIEEIVKCVGCQKSRRMGDPFNAKKKKTRFACPLKTTSRRWYMYKFVPFCSFWW